MSPKKKSKQFKIKNVLPKVSIEKSRVLDEDYPIFCFKYLSDVSIKDYKKSDFFIEFLLR